MKIQVCMSQESKWVKIDNQQEFELKLSQIGWSKNGWISI